MHYQQSSVVIASIGDCDTTEQYGPIDTGGYDFRYSSEPTRSVAAPVCSMLGCCCYSILIHVKFKNLQAHEFLPTKSVVT